jgi:peptidylprolyl isomerase
MSFRLLTGLALIAALVPMVPGEAAPRKKPAAASAPAAPPTPTEADWHTPDPNLELVIDTNKGRIVVEMYPDVAPAHVAQIQTLARRHFFDGQTFFRVIDEFMDQTGDPGNDGKGGSDLPNLKAEFMFKRTAATPFVEAANRRGLVVGFIGALPVSTQSNDLMAMMADGKVQAWPLFCAGVAAMARAGEPDSANSQFFLMRGVSPNLTQKYTGWGRVVAGQDVVNAIKVGEPVDPPQDRMLSVRLASDMPEAERPKIQVLDTRSAAFRATLAAALADQGDSFSVCDVVVPMRGSAGGAAATAK